MTAARPNNALQPTPPPPVPVHTRSAVQAVSRLSFAVRSQGVALPYHREQEMLYGAGKGRYQAQYQQLWEQLVPVSGQADTLQGELVRVIGRLASELYRNGNGNWDMGFRMYTNVLYKHLRDPAVFEPDAVSEIEEDIEDIRGWGNGTIDFAASLFSDGEDAFDRVTDRVVEWCQAHPTPIPYLKKSNQHR